jgi:hypothetical protein
LAYQITGGYPYFLQELGYAVWTVAEGPEVTADDVGDAEPGYEAKLDSSFFRVRLDRTADLQRAYLRAMAQLGPEPQKAADVAALMGRPSTDLGPTRAELINMGLLTFRRYVPGALDDQSVTGPLRMTGSTDAGDRTRLDRQVIHNSSGSRLPDPPVSRALLVEAPTHFRGHLDLGSFRDGFTVRSQTGRGPRKLFPTRLFAANRPQILTHNRACSSRTGPASSADLDLLVAEVRDQLKISAQSGDVAVEHLDAGQLAVLDLRDTPDCDAHDVGHLTLSQAATSPQLGQPVRPDHGERPGLTCSDLFGSRCRDVAIADL